MPDLNRDLRPRQEDAAHFLIRHLTNGLEPILGFSAPPGFGKSVVNQVVCTHLVHVRQFRLTITVSPEIVIEHSLMPQQPCTYHFPKTGKDPILVDPKDWRMVRDQGRQALFDALRAKTPVQPHLVVSYAALRRWSKDPEFLPKDLSDVFWVFDEGHHISESNGNGIAVKSIQERNGPTCFMTATMFRHTGNILIDTATAPIFAVSQADAMSEPDETRYCPKELKMRLEAVPKGLDPMEFMVDLLEKDRHHRLRVFPKSVIKIKAGDSVQTAQKLKDLLVKRHPDLRVLIVVGDTLDKSVLETLEYERNVGRFADSKVDVVIACNRFLEGADWPLCSHAYSLDLTNSLVKMIQFSGRGMRPKRRYPDYPEEWKDTAFFTQVLGTYLKDDAFRDAHLDRAFIMATLVANNNVGLSYLREDLKSCIEMARLPHSGYPNPDAWEEFCSALGLSDEESKLSLDRLAKAQMEVMRDRGLTAKQVTPQHIKEVLRGQNLTPTELAQHEHALNLWVAKSPKYGRVVQGYVRRHLHKLMSQEGLTSETTKNWRWVQASLHECFNKAVEEAHAQEGVMFDVLTPNEDGPSILEMVANLTGQSCQQVTQCLVDKLPWDRWFTRLSMFKQEHGNLDLGEYDENRDLRAWIDRQRDAKRRGTLDSGHENKLVTLGVNLVLSPSDKFAELCRRVTDDNDWSPIPGDDLWKFVSKLRRMATAQQHERLNSASRGRFQWDVELAQFQQEVRALEILIPGTPECLRYEQYYLARRLPGMNERVENLLRKAQTLPEDFKAQWDTLDRAYEKVHQEVTRTRQAAAAVPNRKQDFWHIWSNDRVLEDRLLDYEREAIFQEPLAPELRSFLQAGATTAPAFKRALLNVRGHFSPGSLLDRWFQQLPGEVQREVWSHLGTNAPPMPSRNPDSTKYVIPESHERTEFKDNELKQLSRKFVLGVVKQCPQLFREGHLQRPWLELDSQESPTGQMLAPYLNPGVFIGLSRDQAVAPTNRKFMHEHPEIPNRDHIVFRKDDLDSALSDLEAYPDLGVLVFDSLNAMGNMNLAGVLGPMVRFCEQNARRNGSILLVINLILRSNVAVGDRDLTDFYHEALRKLGLPEVEDKTAYPFGPDTQAKVLHTYKGKDSSFGMHLHCILFTTGPHQNVEGATIHQVKP